jgi:hypothetical protein
LRINPDNDGDDSGDGRDSGDDCVLGEGGVSGDGTASGGSKGAEPHSAGVGCSEAGRKKFVSCSACSGRFGGGGSCLSLFFSPDIAVASKSSSLDAILDIESEVRWRTSSWKDSSSTHFLFALVCVEAR